MNDNFINGNNTADLEAKEASECHTEVVLL